MPNILSSLNPSNTEFGKAKLVKTLIVLFFVFSLLGWVIGLMVTNISEKTSLIKKETVSQTETLEKVSFKGTVTYVEPFLYPGEGISFTLVDSSGKDVILLKAKDQKLQVSEGHFVTVVGKEKKTIDGQHIYLLVDEVIIRNVTEQK